MMDLFNLENLLCKLQGELWDKDVAHQLCDKARSFVSDGRCTEAIDIVQEAWQLTRTGKDSNCHGISLLYLSYVRSRCGSPNERQQALRDCDEAIAVLDLPHNCAIAEIMRAQLELDVLRDNHDSKRCALTHLQRAAQILQEAASDWHAPNGRKREERELFAQVTAKISELAATQPTTPSFELPLPVSLVWPASGAVCLQFAVVLSALKSDQDFTAYELNNDVADYIEVSRFSIRGKLYDIHAWNTASNGSGILRLCQNRQYMAIEIDSHGDKAPYSDWHVLVRQQEWLDRAAQEVVITDPGNERVWIDIVNAESVPPKIIGGIDDARSESQDKRTKVPNMVGLVEAIAKPARLT